MLRRSLFAFGECASATKLGPRSAKLIGQEKKFAAHNYSPLPVVFTKARGIHVTDADGKKYVDFMSGYGAVNQGHMHPKIVKAATQQLSRVTLSCRAFYNDQLPPFAEFVTKYFGYEQVLPMNTGAEAVETSIKIARRYAYERRGVREDQAVIICFNGNFHGRTLACITMSDDSTSYGNYGPLVPGFVRVPYGDAKALAQAFKKYKGRVAGVIAEPVQGEAGVIIPPAGFLKAIRQQCTANGALYIDDEIQAGLGRTGYNLAVEHEDVRPDLVLLAKALGGGVIPVSCVLADAEIMSVITPGTHGSTFGGNPLASAIAVAALDVLKKEKLSQKAKILERPFTEKLHQIQSRFATLGPKQKPIVTATRCRGLWGAIEFDNTLLGGEFATKLTYLCKDNGVLCKATHGNIVRLSPPLVISEKELVKGLAVVGDCIGTLGQSL